MTLLSVLAVLSLAPAPKHRVRYRDAARADEIAAAALLRGRTHAAAVDPRRLSPLTLTVALLAPITLTGWLT